MTVRVIIVQNPFEPASWEEAETEDALDYLAKRFGRWPDGARVYDLDGVGDVTRAAALLDKSALSARDVTPLTVEGIPRLGAAQGPLLVAMAPADPITAIITVLAIGLGLVGALLLMPKIPEAGNRRAASPNNQLSDRGNRPRPNDRIPDIMGEVIAVPDLLTMPYSVYEAHRELEFSFMCLGRGSYEVEDVRDGETKIAQIAGAGVSIYGPGTAPGLGLPEVQIGTAIDGPVLGVAKINAVNGQTLKPPNTNFLRGAKNIRFVAPDLIEGDIGLDDFTDYFEADDEIIVDGADFGAGATLLDTFSTNCRFYADGKVEFQTLDPTTVYTAGDTVVISNAGFAGTGAGGAVIYVDVSGTYTILSVAATYIMLDI